MIMVPLVLIMLYDNYVHFHKYVQLHAYIYLQSQIWLHLWLLLELILWSQNSSPNTSDLFIWVQSLHTRQNWCNRGGNTIFKYINLFVGTVWKCPFVHIMNIQVISVWWWVFGSFKVTPEVFSCFLQTSQVLPHWLNHHFSLILVLYTETLSC